MVLVLTMERNQKKFDSLMRKTRPRGTSGKIFEKMINVNETGE